MKEITRQKYLKMEGKTIGKYTLIKFEENLSKNDNIIFTSKCNRCGWIGITNYKSIRKYSNVTPKKCSHIGGNIRFGDTYGKYTIIKKNPSKLCKNGVLIPYFKVKCNKCGKETIVSMSTLYQTIGRKINNNIECKHEVSN